MIIGSLLKVDYFTVAKILQPILAFSVVLTTSYVSKKFYGNIAGISTGFLIMTSYLFTRLVSPLPETLALVFVPLVIYLYYKATVSGKYKYALASSLIFILVILTHQATTLLLFLIITFITLVILVSKRRLCFLKNYIIFILLPLVIGIVSYGAALFVAPNFAAKILTVLLSYSTSLPFSDPISIWKYLVYLGIVLIFVVVGLYVSLKRRNCKDIFILSWIISLFLLSYSYLVGVNVYTLRVLIHLLIPLTIIGGLGLSYLYHDYKKLEFNSTKNIRIIFLIAIFLISTLFAVSTMENSNFQIIPNQNTEPYGSSLKLPQIVPPTNSDTELASWFTAHGDNKTVVVSNNYVTNQFLLAVTGQPIADILSSEHVIEWGFQNSELTNKDIGYFVFDKRLEFNNTPDKIISHGGFIYYNSNYNITSILPSNVKLVYENQNYMVFQVNK